jgi:hypothetical protein
LTDLVLEPATFQWPAVIALLGPASTEEEQQKNSIKEEGKGKNSCFTPINTKAY